MPKDHPQIEAVGAFDELNVALGAAKLLLPAGERRERLEAAQHALVSLMGELSCAEEDAARYAESKLAKLDDKDLRSLDAAIDELESSGLKFDGWATPGVNPLSVALDQARVVARRAERRLASLPSHGRSVRPVPRQFTNRISDLLWLMAREAERPKAK